MRISEEAGEAKQIGDTEGTGDDVRQSDNAGRTGIGDSGDANGRREWMCVDDGKRGVGDGMIGESLRYWVGVENGFGDDTDTSS